VTAGYSATPQARKLGLRPGCRLLLDQPPPGWELDDPPPIERVRGGPADVVLTFLTAVADLGARLDGLAPAIHPAGALWVAWPRRATGHRSDVTENAIRDAALARGLVDVKVAALDVDWSALKLVWRRENR
jgi:hypothetical protein